MMRKVLLIIFSLNVGILFSQETFPLNGVEEVFEPYYAFINANIVIKPGVEIKNGSLLIKGDKIIGVDSNLLIPKSAIIKDLKGDYIYPSFIDLFSDYGLEKPKKEKYDYKPQYKSNKKGPYHWNQAIHPEEHASERFVSDEKMSRDYMSSGFGSVLTHSQDGIFRGTGVFVLLSNRSDHENILQREAASFYSFKKGVSRQKYPSSLMGSIALIRQTFLDAEWYSSQNVQTNISYQSFNEQQDIPQIFSIKNTLDYQRVFQIADEFEIDFIIKGTGKEYSRIKEIKETNFPIIVPINFPKPYDVSNPEYTQSISLSALKDWESSPYNPSILAEQEINFCITSSGIGKMSDFLKNIRLAIKKGLSKYDALASLTTRPAQMINALDYLGTIEKDKIANFFISSEDIFEEGKIYEHWTVGIPNIINQKQLFDIRGQYNFNSSEFKDEIIEVKGDKESPSALFSSLDSVKLHFSINMTNVNISSEDGSIRALGKFSDSGIIKGRYQNAKGDFLNFIMVRDTVPLNTDKKEDVKTVNTVPSVWFPNKSYGFESLPEQESIIFRNATVWTNEEQGIMLNTDVIISNGKILDIGTLLNPLEYFKESEYITVDASNMHLTCGIIDEHSHIAISNGVNEGTQSVTAEVRIGDVINPDDHNIYRQLSGGVVAAQLLHGSANPIGGQSAIIKLRWGSSSEKMKINGADNFIKFALGENVKQSNWGPFERIRFPQTRMGVEQVFYDAFYRAKKYQEDWNKYNNLNLIQKRNTQSPREDLELNALVEILTSERFITCHSYVQSEINMLMHVADSMGFKVNTFTHILEGYKLAQKLKDHGAGASTFSDWWAYKFEVNDAIPYNASVLNKYGVVTAINSDDAEMGRRLNQEAAKAVKYGRTQEEDAWKMITLNPAKLLHLDNRMGSIKIGKDADIVLWNNNPLSIYAKVNRTYVDGKLMYDYNQDLELRSRDLKERMRLIKLMSESEERDKIKPPKPQKEKLYKCCKH